MDRTAYIVQDLPVALTTRLLPTVTYWNRLEGRPRTDNFERALGAEVRDALWMLCKQWQMGEFRGDDAGSPVFGKVHLTHTKLNKYQPGDGLPVQPFDDETPLEAKVEQRPLPFLAGTQKMALNLRLQMGRQWLKMLAKAVADGDVIGNYKTTFVENFLFDAPNPNVDDDALVCAHREVWQQFAAVAGRSLDGYAFYELLTKPTDWTDEVPGLQVADIPMLKSLADKFKAWFGKLYLQPQTPEENAWKPPFLEYQLACSAPEGTTEKVLTADEYYHGRLDWYNFDVDKSRRKLDDVTPPPPDPPLAGKETLSFIPTPLSFGGMPNTRWWTFEDGKTNFGDIKPGTDEIAKLLLIEFGLVYANDWFLMPYTLDTGSIANIRGLAVTNVFGERFWIEPSGKGDDEDFSRWNMFTLSIKGQQRQPADLSLVLLPTVPKIQEGKTLEEVALIRDEMANMVWGVETSVPLPDGSSKRGSEAATETLKFFRKLFEDETPVPVVLLENEAKIRYEVMNTVPEHWIPFIPVHLPDDNREIQLQRASMLRIFEGAPKPYPKVKPRTALLREGLDKQPQSVYFVHEEEVPRAGVHVSQSFQRTRWLDGRVYVWLGVRKKTGRGEGSSGLAFDRILPKKND